MIRYNPLLCLDFYKTAHAEQYPQTLTKMVSYYTPRMTRLEDTDKVTMFGLQAFIKEYLVDAFDLFFFWEDWEDVLAEYKRVLNATINTDGVGEKRLKALHDLGYLPLEIRAVPEGVRTNIKVPQIEISNTHLNFVWLVNSIETMLSCTMWHTAKSSMSSQSAPATTAWFVQDSWATSPCVVKRALRVRLRVLRRFALVS